MSATPRLGLPHIISGQAGKEITHNEALETIDCLLAGTLAAAPADAPPAEPAVGDTFLVGANGSGPWQGHDNQIAFLTAGGWRFVEPRPGMRLSVAASGLSAEYRGGSWEIGTLRGNSVRVGSAKVIGEQQPPIAEPAGGSTIDTEARAALGAILSALRAHGLIAS
jgi:hypothetical protein